MLGQFLQDHIYLPTECGLSFLPSLQWHAAPQAPSSGEGCQATAESFNSPAEMARDLERQKVCYIISYQMHDQSWSKRKKLQAG